MAEAKHSLQQEALERATTCQTLILNATIIGVARLQAIKIGKRQAQAKGLKLRDRSEGSYAGPLTSTSIAIPELLEQAAETVRINPIFRTLAEREERRRKGNGDDGDSASKPNTAPGPEVRVQAEGVSD